MHEDTHTFLCIVNFVLQFDCNENIKYKAQEVLSLANAMFIHIKLIIAIAMVVVFSVSFSKLIQSEMKIGPYLVSGNQNCLYFYYNLKEPTNKKNVLCTTFQCR